MSGKTNGGVEPDPSHGALSIVELLSALAAPFPQSLVSWVVIATRHVKFGVKAQRFFWFVPTLPVFLPFAVNNLGIFHFHGMEEVVGSIPTRSTIFSITYRVPERLLRSLSSELGWQWCAGSPGT
jgi:hypothetical protein